MVAYIGLPYVAFFAHGTSIGEVDGAATWNTSRRLPCGFDFPKGEVLIRCLVGYYLVSGKVGNFESLRSLQESTFTIFSRGISSIMAVRR